MLEKLPAPIKAILVWFINGFEKWIKTPAAKLKESTWDRWLRGGKD